MLLPREKWFCVPTFNNLEIRHDLEGGRESGEDRNNDDGGWHERWRGEGMKANRKRRKS